MKIKIHRRIILLIPLLFMIVLITACADFLEYRPNNGKGPTVIILTGNDGVKNHYIEYASKLSGLGYYVVIVNSIDFPYMKPGTNNSEFIEIIKKVRQSSNALPGKAAVIGFSRGGGLALACAVQLADQISKVIVYYPSTVYEGGEISMSKYNDEDIANLARQIKVPVLAFQGDMDNYFDCCSLERIRKIRDAAKAKQKEFNLVVYHGAGHGFNFPDFPVLSYDSFGDTDSWLNTLEMLKR